MKWKINILDEIYSRLDTTKEINALKDIVIEWKGSMEEKENLIKWPDPQWTVGQHQLV